MGRENIMSNEVITKESLPSVLREIAKKREIKGTSETLIPRIRKVRERAEKLGDRTTVVQLYQEEFLSAQHMVMEEKAKKPHGSPFRATKGAFIMEKLAREMSKYEEKYHEQIDPIVGARVSRFLGRYADVKGQYNKSEELYKKGLSYFDSLIKPEEKYNRLEFSGFLANSQIKQGKKEGFDLAVQTLKDFDESTEGIWLKENDYYTWAVWKSGIEIRTADYFGEKKNIEHNKIIKDWLIDAESILQMPNGNKEVFQIRIDELSNVKELIW